MHGLGHEQVRDLDRAASILEHVDVVAFDFGVERGAELFPVREQFVQGARFEHRTGENVGADFGAFLHHADAEFLAGLGGLLLQSAGGGETGGACSDDDDVEFHVFALHLLLSSQFFAAGAGKKKGNPWVAHALKNPVFTQGQCAARAAWYEISRAGRSARERPRTGRRPDRSRRPGRSAPPRPC
ncbi:hypothetical protein D9M71_617840 [compost metagenome]